MIFVYLSYILQPCYNCLLGPGFFKWFIWIFYIDSNVICKQNELYVFLPKLYIFIFLMRHNSHIIKLTLLNFTSRYFCILYPQSCAIICASYSRPFLSHEKEIPYSLIVTSHSSMRLCITFYTKNSISKINKLLWQNLKIQKTKAKQNTIQSTI